MLAREINFVDIAAVEGNGKEENPEWGVEKFILIYYTIIILLFEN